jgi:uncharacterized protein YkwD
MRLARFCIGALACGALACSPAIGQSNGTKMGEALAFAAAAGAAQVAESIAEQRARNSAPVAQAGGVAVTRTCDNDEQYGCVSVAPAAGAGDAPAPDMSDDEAHDYVLGYVNGVRKLNGAAPVVRDGSLDAFAQAGSEELAQDHRLGQHMAEHAQELHASSAEVQGSPDGEAPGPLQDQLAQILLRMMGEGAGGMHHDVLLRPEWRKLGVGIASRGGRLYFTIDFSNGESARTATANPRGGR